MSHYVKGALKVKCSIDIMRRALIAIMPSWEKHIQIDTQGRIPIYDYNSQINKVQKEDGTDEIVKYHLMVPSPKNPNYDAAPGNNWADLGLRQNPDKTWEVTGDWGGMGSTSFKNTEEFEIRVGAQIAKMKAEAWAKYLGSQVKTQDSADSIRIEISVSADQAKKLKKKVLA